MSSSHRFKNIVCLVSVALIASAAGALGSVTQEDSGTAVAIHAGRVIDGHSAAPLGPSVILIEGGRITEVGPDVVIPAGAQEINLSDATVLPGLIDAHTHVLFAPQDGKNPVLEKSVAFRTLEAAAAARLSLEAGFTTLRDTDSEGADFADVAVRDAIADGLIPGPRLLVSTMALRYALGIGQDCRG
mgnify:FL=1